MARQVVMLPNGLYGCWSTIIDNFIAVNLTEKEYIEMRASEAYEEKRQEMQEIFQDIRSGGCKYVKDYDLCLELLEANNGEESLNDVINEINKVSEHFS